MTATQASTEGEPGTAGWAAFRHPDFAFYCASRFLSALAIQMQNVAVGWLVYNLTHDPLALGLVGLAGFLPAICLALVTGHVADRFDRRAVLLVCYSVTMASAAGLFVHAWSGSVKVWPIYALIMAYGTARAFANPAGQALLPNLVPAIHFQNAVAWNSSAWQTATIIGPALGGILYAFGGTVVFGAAVVAFAATTLLVAAISHRGGLGRREKASWASLVAGILFIRSRPAILGAISLDLFAVLLGGATALLPIYARDILMVGPGPGPAAQHAGRGGGADGAVPGLQPARSTLGAPHVPGGGRVRARHHRLRPVDQPLSLDVLPVHPGCRRHGQRVRAPDPGPDRHARCDARPRGAVNAVFIGASNELGEFESGVLAALVGTVPAVVIGGLGTLAVAGLWSRWFPALRDRDKLVG